MESLLGSEDGSKKKKNIRIIALNPLDSYLQRPADADSSSFSGYAIYIEDSKTVADWIDLQVLISQENQRSLHQETLNCLKERGTAVFKTREQAENALFVLEKSLETNVL